MFTNFPDSLYVVHLSWDGEGHSSPSGKTVSSVLVDAPSFISVEDWANAGHLSKDWMVVSIEKTYAHSYVGMYGGDNGERINVRIDKNGKTWTFLSLAQVPELASKPEVGERVQVNEDSASFADFKDQKLVVFKVFDSLSESWDPYGELAWSQADVNKESGKTGDWYVLVEPNPGEVLSLASYEVAR